MYEVRKGLKYAEDSLADSFLSLSNVNTFGLLPYLSDLFWLVRLYVLSYNGCFAALLAVKLRNLVGPLQIQIKICSYKKRDSEKITKTEPEHNPG